MTSALAGGEPFSQGRALGRQGALVVDQRVDLAERGVGRRLLAEVHDEHRAVAEIELRTLGPLELRRQRHFAPRDLDPLPSRVERRARVPNVGGDAIARKSSLRREPRQVGRSGVRTPGGRAVLDGDIEQDRRLEDERTARVRGVVGAEILRADHLEIEPWQALVLREGELGFELLALRVEAPHLGAFAQSGFDHVGLGAARRCGLGQALRQAARRRHDRRAVLASQVQTELDRRLLELTLGRHDLRLSGQNGPLVVEALDGGQISLLHPHPEPRVAIARRAEQPLDGRDALPGADPFPIANGGVPPEVDAGLVNRLVGHRAPGFCPRDRSAAAVDRTVADERHGDAEAGLAAGERLEIAVVRREIAASDAVAAEERRAPERRRHLERRVDTVVLVVANRVRRRAGLPRRVEPALRGRELAFRDLPIELRSAQHGVARVDRPQHLVEEQPAPRRRRRRGRWGRGGRRCRGWRGRCRQCALRVRLVFHEAERCCDDEGAKPGRDEPGRCSSNRHLSPFLPALSALVSGFVTTGGNPLN